MQVLEEIANRPKVSELFQFHSVNAECAKKLGGDEGIFVIRDFDERIVPFTEELRQLTNFLEQRVSVPKVLMYSASTADSYKRQKTPNLVLFRSGKDAEEQYSKTFY